MHGGTKVCQVVLGNKAINGHVDDLAVLCYYLAHVCIEEDNKVPDKKNYYFRYGIITCTHGSQTPPLLIIISVSSVEECGQDNVAMVMFIINYSTVRVKLNLCITCLYKHVTSVISQCQCVIYHFI